MSSVYLRFIDIFPNNLDSSLSFTQPGISHQLFFWTCPLELPLRASLVAQRLKHLPAMWETLVRSLGWEDPLEKEMATHSSILAWRTPWTEEPGRLQSMRSQRARQDWETSLWNSGKAMEPGVLPIRNDGKVWLPCQEHEGVLFGFTMLACVGEKKGFFDTLRVPNCVWKWNWQRLIGEKQRNLFMGHRNFHREMKTTKTS